MLLEDVAILFIILLEDAIFLFNTFLFHFGIILFNTFLFHFGIIHLMRKVTLFVFLPLECLINVQTTSISKSLLLFIKTTFWQIDIFIDKITSSIRSLNVPATFHKSFSFETSRDRHRSRISRYLQCQSYSHQKHFMCCFSLRYIRLSHT